MSLPQLPTLSPLPSLAPISPLGRPKLPPLRNPPTVVNTSGLSGHAARMIQVSTGDDFVQVRCKQADDAAARVEFIANGVEFVGRSMVPVTGTLHVFASIAGDDYVYRWRK